MIEKGSGRAGLRRVSLVAALLVALFVVACSDDEGADTTAAAAPEAVEVTAVDYAFVGLPAQVAAGTTLTLVNDSEVELHEIVAIRLPDDETRSVEELLADPEAGAALAPNVVTVIIAPPLDGGFPVVGTGALTEPGRYAIICAIPTGADPVEYMEAAAEAEGGPPEVDGGPPHFVVGMFAELTVGE